MRTLDVLNLASSTHPKKERDGNVKESRRNREKESEIERRKLAESRLFHPSFESGFVVSVPSVFANAPCFSR